MFEMDAAWTWFKTWDKCQASEGVVAHDCPPASSDVNRGRKWATNYYEDLAYK